MKTLKIFILIVFFTSLICSSFISANNKDNKNENSVTVQQVSLDANNTSTWIWNTGVFNQDLRTNNTPGFNWPKGTTKFAIFTTGLTIAAYVNNQLRMAAASYKGEFEPGFCTNGTIQTNSTFKLYKVTRGDNSNNNPDWANWGLMVPYGAPFEDINNNGTYEPATDKAGVKGSAQTIFLCMTDADPLSHTSTEGFGGGTSPLGAEVHFTAWCYDNSGYEDMQFLKWTVINKNTTAWDSTYFSIVSDPDLGDANDDAIGCDTTIGLGYCYNSEDFDAVYGLHPPAVGTVFLNCSASNLGMNSFDFFTNTGSGGTVCEQGATTPISAYNYMKGYKKDGTPWINIHTCLPTKFCFSNDWMEGEGKVANCGNVICQVVPSLAGDKRYVMSTRPVNQRLNPGDTQIVQISQLIARGSNNLNSLTKLVAKAAIAKELCQNGFVIGINPISTEIPDKFSLYQNYPNPFNPNTVIKFQITNLSDSKLIIYNALGKEITTLVNEELKPGTYSIEWNASNYPSGVYFYKLQAGDYSETKKMVLIK